MTFAGRDEVQVPLDRGDERCRARVGALVCGRPATIVRCPLAEDLYLRRGALAHGRAPGLQQGAVLSLYAPYIFARGMARRRFAWSGPQKKFTLHRSLSEYF